MASNKLDAARRLNIISALTIRTLKTAGNINQFSYTVGRCAAWAIVFFAVTQNSVMAANATEQHYTCMDYAQNPPYGDAQPPPCEAPEEPISETVSVVTGTDVEKTENPHDKRPYGLGLLCGLISGFMAMSWISHIAKYSL